MSATPDRLNISMGRLQSPRTPASPAGSTIGASRVEDSIRKFVELYKKWQTTIQKGTQYCNAIENIKKGVLESKDEDCNPYPANLELYCKNVAILNTILEDVVHSLDTMLEQLKVLHVVVKDEIVGRTWNLGKVLEVLRSISEHFKSELSVRKAVSENIGHSTEASELALHVSFWEQLSSQNENVHLLVRMLSVEFNIALS